MIEKIKYESNYCLQIISLKKKSLMDTWAIYFVGIQKKKE